MRTALSICTDLDLGLGSARRRDILRAYALADDGGTISPQGMLELTRDPASHTATSLRAALLMLGCTDLARPAART